MCEGVEAGFAWSISSSNKFIKRFIIINAVLKQWEYFREDQKKKAFKTAELNATCVYRLTRCNEGLSADKN